MKLPTSPPSNRLGTILLSIGLVAITLFAYRQVGTFSFVLFDDIEYVTDNPVVKAGLTQSGLAWAFSEPHASNWHPLTWVSHMADVELFGVEPGAHHLVNLFFHTANTLLLFLMLTGVTGNRWRSAFVAALFAVHPLHVESVAWVSERKDVLSTFFWFLSLWAYAGYAKRGGAGRYLAVLAFFLLGLMSKSMLVTLPFLLLLLDFWPLRRTPFETDDAARESTVDRPTVRLLLIEKVPFLLLSVLFSIVTFLAQKSGGSVSGHPIGLRAANAFVSFLAYLQKMAWPAGLTMFYPHPSIVGGATLPGLKVAAAVIAFFGLSLVAILQARRRPWLFTGWFWYVVTLVPVIGLVQVGRQAMADRYTYVPLVGIFIAISWTVPGWFERRRFGRAFLFGAAAAVLAALTASTSLQAPIGRIPGNCSPMRSNRSRTTGWPTTSWESSSSTKAATTRGNGSFGKRSGSTPRWMTHGTTWGSSR